MQVILPLVKFTEDILFQAIKNSKEMGENGLPDSKLKFV